MGRCSWCTTPCTVRRGRRPRRRWSPRTASCCCTTCTRSWCWCTRCSWPAGRRASGTAWRCGWLRSRGQARVNQTRGRGIPQGPRPPKPRPHPTWPLAQAPVDGVDAGLRLQAAGGGLGQVAAEARVAGLAGQPLQAGVGEGGHVLPAPVGHVDLAQPHPGRDGGLVLQTHHSSRENTRLGVSATSQRGSRAANASCAGAACLRLQDELDAPRRLSAGLQLG